MGPEELHSKTRVEARYSMMGMVGIMGIMGMVGMIGVIRVMERH
jgi:hypothetical protein